MKVLIFFAGSFFGVFGGILGCYVYRPLMYFFFCLMLFSLVFPEISINFASRELYRGTTRGFEVSLADLCAIILIFAMLLWPSQYKITWMPPLSFLFMLFFLFAIISWFSADYTRFNPFSEDPTAFKRPNLYLDPVFETKLYPLFEMSKLLRGYIIFWCSVNFIRDRKAIDCLLYFACIASFYFAGVSLFQRYALGVHRVSAISDTNIFNCFVGMIGALVLPFAFETKSTLKSIIFWGASLAGFLSIVLTISRSSLFGYFLALLFSIAFSLYRFKGKKNVLFTVLFGFLCLLVVVKAYQTLFTRFIELESTSSSLLVRESYSEEAFLMGKEHFFGVGIGNFSAYSASEYANRVGTEKGALVHNIWWLSLAELGVPGLFSFCMLWAWYYAIFLRAFFSKILKNQNYTYALLIGIFSSLLVLQIQSIFHFSYRFTSIFFLVNILMGLTVRIFLEVKNAEKAIKIEEEEDEFSQKKVVPKKVDRLLVQYLKYLCLPWSKLEYRRYFWFK